DIESNIKRAKNSVLENDCGNDSTSDRIRFMENLKGIISDIGKSVKSNLIKILKVKHFIEKGGNSFTNTTILGQNELEMAIDSFWNSGIIESTGVGLVVITEFLIDYSEQQSYIVKESAIEYEYIELLLDILFLVDLLVPKQIKAVPSNGTNSSSVRVENSNHLLSTASFENSQFFKFLKEKQLIEKYYVKSKIVQSLANFAHGSYKKIQDLVRTHTTISLKSLNENGLTNNNKSFETSMVLSFNDIKETGGQNNDDNDNDDFLPKNGTNGLFLVLNMMQIDDFHPYLREHAIATP
ncbi:hypothetical protein BB560_005057, partial [Smittium megazygosporum]